MNKMLIGQEWQADCDRSFKLKGSPEPLLSLSGSLSIKITDTGRLELIDCVGERIGLCLIRLRSKSISLICIVTEVVLIDGTYFIKWASDGIFYPKPRVMHIKGPEFRVFI